MRFTGLDLKIMVTMLITILALSAIYGGLGMTETENYLNETPELDIDSASIDFAGDQPERPTDIDEALLKKSPDALATEHEEYLQGGPQKDKYLLAYLRAETDEVSLTYYNGTDTITDTKSFNETGDRGLLELDTNDDDQTDYRAIYEVEEFDNSTSPHTTEVRVELDTVDENEGFMGSLISFAEPLEGVYQTLAWMGSMFLWVSMVIVEFFLNVTSIAVTIGMFFIDYVTFIMSAYTELVSAAPGIAGLVLAVPGLLLSLEFGKIALLIVDVWWFG